MVRHQRKNAGEIAMSWIEVIKGDNVVYSGRCRKCRKLVMKGEKCPFNLPAKTPELMTADTCPQKVKQ